MAFLDPVLSPLLKFPPVWVVLGLSLFISLLIIVIYKFTTNQALMKQLKEEMKASQKQMKELREQPEKMIEVQKKAMQANMKYMSHSMKSTLFTFLPIIVLFGWMNAHYAFIPIAPGDAFNTTITTRNLASGEVTIEVPEEIEVVDGNTTQQISDNKATWLLKAKQDGEYFLNYKIGNQLYSKELLVTEEQSYAEPVNRIKDKNAPVNEIRINYRPLKIANLFGWEVGWLGTYIISSIIFSMLLRKWFKVY